VSRITAAVSRLASRLQSRAGVSVVYTREAGQPGERSVTLVAIPGGERQPVTEPQGRGGRVDRLDRDYLIVAADLVLGGTLVTPESGDRVTETIDGTACVFELLATPGEPCWRYTDATRQMIRVHTKPVS
jgi:hypothetical protein